MKWFFQTKESWASVATRMALGIVMFPHGAQKMLGWYGEMDSAVPWHFLLNKWVCQRWLPFW